MSLNAYKSMGLDGMHPRVPKELLRSLLSCSPSYLKSCGCQVSSQMTLGRVMLLRCLRKGEIMFHWSVQLHMLFWTIAGPKGAASPLSQKCIFNRSSSVKYYFLGSHKPSFSDNPKSGNLILVTSLVSVSVTGLSYCTYSRRRSSVLELKTMIV